MHDEYCGNCRHDMMDDKNRFQPENRFVGDIEDGKRYPFDVYTKSESDEKYALKNTETDITALANMIGTKADEAECEDIRARLDALEYEEIGIKSFTAVPSVCEMGSSNTVNLSWTLTKAAEQQNINGTPVTGNTRQYTGVTSSVTYTLNASDGKTTASRALEITFANRIYYGAAADLSAVTGLSIVLSSVKTRTFSVNAGAGDYIIYAIPARLGYVTFFSGGFEGGFEAPVEQLLTNASGYQEMYRIYRSANASLGETTVEVREG